MCLYIYVIFCHLLYVLYVYCMYMYMYILIYMYICMCIYIYMFHVYVYLKVCSIYLCIFICASLYVCDGTHFCWYKGNLFYCLSCRYLGCYLSVWHCYLGSILASSFEIVKLKKTTDTKSYTQVIKINLGNMNSLFPTIIVKNSSCMHLFIRIKF